MRYKSECHCHDAKAVCWAGGVAATAFVELLQRYFWNCNNGTPGTAATAFLGHQQRHSWNGSNTATSHALVQHQQRWSCANGFEFYKGGKKKRRKQEKHRHKCNFSHFYMNFDAQLSITSKENCRKQKGAQKKVNWKERPKNFRFKLRSKITNSAGNFSPRYNWTDWQDLFHT